MPISRDARMDRRRRLLRDSVEADNQEDGAPRRGTRKATATDEADGLLPKRKAGYSQDVRRACGQRLVQFIPVRRRSYAAVACISFLIPTLLLAAHYLVHVTGQLQWWRHPLAVALDIGHPRSIAAWLCSQLWLLCLIATVLTFQLRRHKLDDYKGEYRLWFWLVLTCLLASLDSTTSITDLFALALDPWAQWHLGWSGPAVVDLTLAVLVGMLGLRMCSELKVVPVSLLWWLGGLVTWACSAALARPEFQLEMSAPVRYWLISACWLSGLTMVWLAALTYLRFIYIEAQQRFVLRGRLAVNAPPLSQRLRQSLPSWPHMGRQRAGSESAESLGAADGTAPTARRWGLPAAPKFLKRGGLRSDDAPAAASEEAARRRTRKTEPVAMAAAESNRPSADESKNKSRWTGWLRRPKDNDDAEEYRKVTGNEESQADVPRSRAEPPLRAPRQESSRGTRQRDGDEAESVGEETTAQSRRRWLPKLPRPSMSLPKLARPKLPLPKLKIPKPKLPTFTRRKASDEPGLEKQPKSEKQSSTEKRGLLSRLKIPKLGLSAFKLQPPDEDTRVSERPQNQPPAQRPVAAAARPLPSTQPPVDDDDYFEDDEQDGRTLSKAERKRLRRNQQQQRRSA